MIVQPSGLIDSTFDDLSDLRGQPNLCRSAAGCIVETQFNSATNLGQVHAEAAQDADSNPFPFAGEGEHEVFDADGVVLKTLCFFHCSRENPADLHGEGVKPLVTYLH